MLDIKDLSFLEKQNNFDFKSFLIKIVGYWKWFILSFIITFSIAHQVNVRKQKIYGIGTTISVKEENNQMFTSNTSLIFNWGGTSDKVQMIATSLKSRSHNELVVDDLQFYIDYIIKTPYYYKDVYGQVPFKITIDKSQKQLYEEFIKLKFLNSNTYQISIPFSDSSAKCINYFDNTLSHVTVKKGEFVKTFKVGQKVDLPFLNWKLMLEENPAGIIGQEILIRFNSFNNTVIKYKGITIDIDEKAPSIINLSMQGTNKNRMVDYLNSTVDVLIKRQLESKNKFAENTISFIDETLANMEKELKNSGDELRDFSKTMI